MVKQKMTFIYGDNCVVYFMEKTLIVYNMQVHYILMKVVHLH